MIDDLGAEDFVVLHDGDEAGSHERLLLRWTERVVGHRRGGTARTDRYFILMFHDQRMQAPQLAGPQMDNARWLKRWIEEELQPNDQVWPSSPTRLGSRSTSTSAATATRSWRRWMPLRGARETSNAGSRVRIPSSIRTRRPSSSTCRRGRSFPAQPQLQEALELVGEASAGIAGRKNLVMFSLGFGEIGQFGSYTPDPRYYPQMREALNAGNVAVYTIDTMGSRRRSIASASLNDSLSLISNETGGHYYANFTNIMSPMRQVAEENQGYYLVSFRSEYEAGTQGYRDIKVKVRDGNYKVRSRTDSATANRPVLSAHPPAPGPGGRLPSAARAFLVNGRSALASVGCAAVSRRSS